MTIQSAAEQLKLTHLALTRETDFSIHNKSLNQALSTLVANMGYWHSKGYGAKLVDEPSLAHTKLMLPKFCAKAECQMEQGWAEDFLAEPNLTPQSLKRFWYYQNYQEIMQDELALIEAHMPDAKGLTFVGSGPLPLSSIIVALLKPEWSFDCVDFDAKACALSSALIEKLGLSHRINVVQAKAEEHSYNPHFATMIASLIDNKSAVYDKVGLDGLKHFMVRDAEDVFQFLYTPAENPTETLWRCAGQTQPSSTRINTTKVFTKRSM